MTNKITLREEVVGCLERFAYEKEVTTAVVAVMVHNDYDQNSELFRHFHDEMVKATIRYSECYKIVSEAAKADGIKVWKINYTERIMEYEK